MNGERYMERHTPLILAALVLSLSGIAAMAADIRGSQNSSIPNRWRAPPGMIVEPSRRMHPEGIPWEDEIQIALPASYYKTTRTYPVLWVTDGSYNFDRAVSVVNSLNNDHLLPEMIIVAVGNPPDKASQYVKRRLYEFTPIDGSKGGPSFEGFGAPTKQQLEEADKVLQSNGWEPATQYGGAPRFLSFLVDVLRPALAKDYRMSNEHTLFGHSGGGIFCTYALLARPESFDKYICGSPALYWANFELFRMEETYSRTHKDLVAKVFFGAGEDEMLKSGALFSSMSRMAEILIARKYRSLTLRARVFSGEDHITVIPLTLSWGLRTLWANERRNEKAG